MIYLQIYSNSQTSTPIRFNFISKEPDGKTVASIGKGHHVSFIIENRKTLQSLVQEIFKSNQDIETHLCIVKDGNTILKYSQLGERYGNYEEHVKKFLGKFSSIVEIFQSIDFDRYNHLLLGKSYENALTQKLPVEIVQKIFDHCSLRDAKFGKDDLQLVFEFKNGIEFSIINILDYISFVIAAGSTRFIIRNKSLLFELLNFNYVISKEVTLSLRKKGSKILSRVVKNDRTTDNYDYYGHSRVKSKTGDQTFSDKLFDFWQLFLSMDREEQKANHAFVALPKIKEIPVDEQNVVSRDYLTWPLSSLPPTPPPSAKKLQKG